MSAESGRDAETDCEAAIEELAALLYWKIEHIDPGGDPEFVKW